MITVLLLTWNGAEHLAGCLGALRAQVGGPPALLVVDNGSHDESLALVRQHYPEAEIIANGRNLGFSGGMNVGLQHLLKNQEPRTKNQSAQGNEGNEGNHDQALRTFPSFPVFPLPLHHSQRSILNSQFTLLLNQDTVVSPDWVQQIVAPFAEGERIGAVGCKIFYPDGVTLQHAGGLLDGARASSTHRGYGEVDSGQYDQPCELEFVTGAALALRLSTLAEVGLFDEGYNPAYYEEVDLCWRLRRAGYLVRYQPTATLRHAESASITNLVRRSTLANRNRLRFVVKTFDSERLWNDFLLAERMRIAMLPNSPETEVLRRAYLEGVLQQEEWIAARAMCHPPTDGETARLRQLCADLRRDISAFDRGRTL